MTASVSAAGVERPCTGPRPVDLENKVDRSFPFQSRVGLLHDQVTSDLPLLSERGWKVVVVPKPYPEEFREDVARVARGREPGVTLDQIAADFGVHPMTLSK